MIFHLVLNSFFVFFATAILIELLLFLFKIKKARIRYLCRLFPILKLPFDLLVFGIYGESFFINLNPLSCEMFVQNIIAKFLQIEPKADEGLFTIIPESIAKVIPDPYFKGFIIGTLFISILIMSRKVFHFVTSRIQLKKILQDSSICERMISNQQLNKNLDLCNAYILTSAKIQVPFAVGLNKIIFPKELVKKLSQEEFEAVVSHELEHLRWKDPLIRSACNMICSIFWWIPTRWWINRLEIDQERASDLGIFRYNIDPYDLAAAFVKTAQITKYPKLKISSICPFLSIRNTHIKRLEHILDSHQFLPKRTVKPIMGIGMCFLICLSFWMC